MIHPLVTILFDVLLIGSTVSIIGGIAVDTYMHRQPSVGAPNHGRAPRAARRRTHSLTARRAAPHRRGVMLRG